MSGTSGLSTATGERDTILEQRLRGRARKLSRQNRTNYVDFAQGERTTQLKSSMATVYSPSFRSHRNILGFVEVEPPPLKRPAGADTLNERIS
jgi:hypothetical protein